MRTSSPVIHHTHVLAPKILVNYFVNMFRSSCVCRLLVPLNQPYNALGYIGRRPLSVTSMISTPTKTQEATETGSQPSSLPSDPLAERLKDPDFFGVRKILTIKEMFEARVHLGHKEGTLNNLMKPFILGSRMGSLIIDLQQTKELLGDALNFTAHVASRGGIILFVNRSRQVCHDFFSFLLYDKRINCCLSLCHVFLTAHTTDRVHG